MKISIVALSALMLTAGAALAAEGGRLTIATEGAYPPFNTIGPDGQLSGFDVDIARALCTRMKAECTFVAQEWDGIIPGLQAGKYDAIVASLSITEERRKEVLFTKKYYETPLSLVARKGSGIAGTDPAALSGKAIGAQGATTQSQYAQEHYGAAGAEVKLYPTYEEAAIDLENGRLDVVISDRFVLMDWLGGAGKDCCEMVGDIPGTESEAGTALRLGEEVLRDRFDAALEAIIADGTYGRIRARYFSFDIY